MPRYFHLREDILKDIASIFFLPINWMSGCFVYEGKVTSYADSGEWRKQQPERT
jgi:hypothetical protein